MKRLGSASSQGQTPAPSGLPSPRLRPRSDHQHSASSTQLIGNLIKLLENVNIPILIVDADLLIRRFTLRTQTVLNLVPSDVGSPLADVNIRLKIPDLSTFVANVLK